ncbi:hypothetical protein EAN04_24665 [Salmonella enterica]|nr:hypothetical protein [Salmonella enterica]
MEPKELLLQKLLVAVINQLLAGGHIPQTGPLEGKIEGHALINVEDIVCAVGWRIVNDRDIELRAWLGIDAEAITAWFNDHPYGSWLNKHYTFDDLIWSRLDERALAAILYRGWVGGNVRFALHYYNPLTFFIDNSHPLTGMITPALAGRVARLAELPRPNGFLADMNGEYMRRVFGEMATKENVKTTRSTPLTRKLCPPPSKEECVLCDASDWNGSNVRHEPEPMVPGWWTRRRQMRNVAVHAINHMIRTKVIDLADPVFCHGGGCELLRICGCDSIIFWEDGDYFSFDLFFNTTAEKLNDWTYIFNSERLPASRISSLDQLNSYSPSFTRRILRKTFTAIMSGELVRDVNNMPTLAGDMNGMAPGRFNIMNSAENDVFEEIPLARPNGFKLFPYE